MAFREKLAEPAIFIRICWDTKVSLVSSYKSTYRWMETFKNSPNLKGKLSRA